jgi:hypothetical protein
LAQRIEEAMTSPKLCIEERLSGKQELVERIEMKHLRVVAIGYRIRGRDEPKRVICARV